LLGAPFQSLCPIPKAVITNDEGEIIGRFTLFRGYGENNAPVITRASKLHLSSSHMVDEASVDKKLEEYARSSGIGFIREGIIKIPGLRGVYDDYVAGYETKWNKDGVIVEVRIERKNS